MGKQSKLIFKTGRRRAKMREVFLTVNYKGKNYQTNVIVKSEMSWDQIKRLAEEQVEKQWRT
jgi:hypothetical protein